MGIINEDLRGFFPSVTGGITDYIVERNKMYSNNIFGSCEEFRSKIDQLNSGRIERLDIIDIARLQNHLMNGCNCEKLLDKKALAFLCGEGGEYS